MIYGSRIIPTAIVVVSVVIFGFMVVRNIPTAIVVVTVVIFVFVVVGTYPQPS